MKGDYSLSTSTELFPPSRLLTARSDQHSVLNIKVQSKISHFNIKVESKINEIQQVTLKFPFNWSTLSVCPGITWTMMIFTSDLSICSIFVLLPCGTNDFLSVGCHCTCTRSTILLLFHWYCTPKPADIISILSNLHEQQPVSSITNTLYLYNIVWSSQTLINPNPHSSFSWVNSSP